MHSPYITDGRPLFSAQHVGVVSVCLFITFERVREKLTASSSNDCYWRLRLFENVLAIVIAVYMWQLSFPVKNAHFSGFEFVYMLLACENKDKVLLMKTIVWFSNVLVFLCFSDEGPYTKHSNPSRPPDGALAIRRQSIPGTKHNAWFVTAVLV